MSPDTYACWTWLGISLKSDTVTPAEAKSGLVRVRVKREALVRSFFMVRALDVVIVSQGHGVSGRAKRDFVECGKAFARPSTAGTLLVPGGDGGQDDTDDDRANNSAHGVGSS